MRVISTPTFKKVTGVYERNRYVYQMPYNDNYLDYQNDTAVLCCDNYKVKSKKATRFIYVDELD